jgi:hypothetical protein
VSERVAIVGSREGADLDEVRAFVRALWEKYPDTILVSGGAKGVDQAAEQEWLALGGQVESLRPVQLGPDHYTVEKWYLGGPTPSVYTLANEPTWENYKSAATYRDILIAETADRVVAFTARPLTRGTAFTVESARETYGKPTYVYERSTS